MKKIILLSFISAMGIIACSKKTVPTTGTSTPEKSETKTETVKSDTDMRPATAEKIQADIEAKKKEEEKQGRTPPPMTMMDNGKNVFVTKCGKCHALKNTGDYTANQWDGILKAMAPKAKLSGDETRQVEAYIKANAKQ